MLNPRTPARDARVVADVVVELDAVCRGRAGRRLSWSSWTPSSTSPPRLWWCAEWGPTAPAWGPSTTAPTLASAAVGLLVAGSVIASDVDVDQVAAAQITRAQLQELAAAGKHDEITKASADGRLIGVFNMPETFIAPRRVRTARRAAHPRGRPAHVRRGTARRARPGPAGRPASLPG